MTFNLSEQQEKKYLQQVIGIINDTIQNTDTSVKEHVETLQEYKDYRSPRNPFHARKHIKSFCIR